ncbi:cation:proton antiporter [Cellulomonas rhizosphaerae]|uniref:Cation:proton antiporter n=1 Tax=Cellulomonas rhizosphaerae TaxID=2293719 RepID=A0A413RHV0_9CELL|nr:cation:proton antiporter [Cellulomonas rhizosphaerae]RHA37770.1 cation:proton antiporter [Cellulomonas rhizosphaerae]
MEFEKLLPVVIVSALALLVVAAMPSRYRLPQVVVLLAGGVVIGPEALGLSSPGDVGLLSDLGMGFLFLLAGYEIDPGIARRPAGRLGMRAWVSSFVLGAVLLYVLSLEREIPSATAIAIALSTTALGILVPILKDENLEHRPLGAFVIAGGAIGELGPIVAMAVLLGTGGTAEALFSLTLFAAAVVVLALTPRRFTLVRTRGLLSTMGEGTSQAPLRITLVLLVALLANATFMGFDAVLGAFLAGMVLRSWSPVENKEFERKLDAVGWGVFIPIFFVSSGMGLQIHAMAETPWLPLAFVAIILVVRGGPALFWYRKVLPARDRVRLALYTATTLPLLVALTELAVDDGTLDPGKAACLVGAGALTVLVFPLLSRAVGSRSGTEDTQVTAEAH